jgi:FkbM family methyltransferase
MKKIFIDGGARIGESLEHLLDKRDDLKGCDVYFFECNSDHIQTLNNIKNYNNNYNFFVREEAIWIEDGEMPFYISIDRWGDLGCTLDKNKSEKLDLENPRIVKTIDISKFIDSFSDEDYIILKLDIEGAEYEVVSHLINTKKIHKIKELHVEWHDIFFMGKKHSLHLKEILSRTNIIVNHDWI